MSTFRSGVAVHFSGVKNDDDDMVVDLRHKKFKVGPKTPLVMARHQPFHRFFNGDSHQFRLSVGFRAREEFTLWARRHSWSGHFSRTQSFATCRIFGVPSLEHTTKMWWTGIPSGVHGLGSIRMSHAASDSHSVDGEENTPRSDTETVGGISNVSIDASSSSVVLEPEVVVHNVVVGRAVRKEIRGLDALDISAMFSPCLSEVSAIVSEWRIPFYDAGIERNCHGG